MPRRVWEWKICHALWDAELIFESGPWIPASAGMTGTADGGSLLPRGWSCLHSNEGQEAGLK